MSIAIFDSRWFQWRLNFTSAYHPTQRHLTMSMMTIYCLVLSCGSFKCTDPSFYYEKKITEFFPSLFDPIGTFPVFVSFCFFLPLIFSSFLFVLDNFRFLSRNKLNRTLRSLVLNIRFQLALACFCFDVKNVEMKKERVKSKYRKCLSASRKTCTCAILRQRAKMWTETLLSGWKVMLSFRGALKNHNNKMRYLCSLSTQSNIQ